MVHINDEQKEMAEIVSFQLSYSKKDIKATWILATIIASVYLLEEFFGGSNNASVLVRMGANVRELVADGQYFRILTSVFLHAGFMHVFFNTYVLFALGGFFNRILGEAKYLTVFFISGIAGSVASFYLGKGVISVGASGALWGLFGASIALAFFKNPLIPDSIRLRLRKVTLINLAINLGVSFLPMVDMWAHFGGGIAGFLISLLMIFNNKNIIYAKFKNYLFQVLAIVLGLAYLSSIIFVIVSFKPWQDKFSAPLSEIPLQAIPFSLKIPQGLALKSSEQKDHHAIFVYGDLALDQMVIELQFFKDAAFAQDLAQEWLKAQHKQFLQDPKIGTDIKRSLDLRTRPEGPELFYKLEPEGQVAAYTYIFIRHGYAIKLVIVTQQIVNQVKVEKLARDIIDSIKIIS